MRGLVLASLFLAALAHTEEPAGRARKSLGFGPAHPHAVYKSSPYQIVTNGFTSQDPEASPFDVARLFVDDLLRDQLSESSSYTIRDDSYVDKTSGIAHIYVRQVVNGLEVADGDINLNIKDGVVLSYGNSFYSGNAPTPFTTVSPEDVVHPHQEFCNSIASTIDGHFAQLQNLDGQVTMSPEFQLYSDHLVRVKADHCEGLEFVPDTFAEAAAKADVTDLRHALLQFMIAATPNSETLNNILADYDGILNKMNTWSPGLFGPSDDERYMHVENVPDTVSPVKAKMAYIQVPNKAGDATELSLVWKFEVEMQDNWYEASVSMAAPHRIISVVDWASDAYLRPVPKPEEPSPKSAVYTAYAWGVNDPSTGDRTLIKENDDFLASPVGWHSLPYSEDPSFGKYAVRPKSFYRNTTTTWGNNVFAQENWEGRNAFIDNLRPDGGKDLNFTYPYNPTEVDRSEALGEARSWINSTVTQLFYTSNMVHDMFYRYGFDEEAGNFQQYNFERGGKGGDGVIANAQDGSGFNNANFMTPPDGQNGRMRMYIWNTANPYRDGDLEAGIVIHELSHGTSTRLTGGPANSGCLGWGESGGMGEGWGDFFATSIRANKKYSDYAMGSWAANKEGGIRNYPYSTDKEVNPSSYKTLDKPGYWGVHAIGEVWAEMLWVVEQRLIEQHGYSDTLYPPQANEDGTVPEGDFYKPKVGKKALVPKHGNTLAIQLVVNGMKLQPCRPSFFDARDAIILADQQLTDGENFCTIWKAFSERGLGQDAGVEGKTPWGGGVRTDGFKVPAACKSE